MKTRLLIIGGIGFLIVFVLMIRSCSSPSNKGEIVYKENCSSCHGDNGEGFAMFPPLQNADYMLNHSDNFACMVFYGINDTITVNGESYNQAMPANTKLSETDLTNLANYIFKTFTNSSKTFTVDEINAQLKNCSKE